MVRGVSKKGTKKTPQMRSPLDEFSMNRGLGGRQGLNEFSMNKGFGGSSALDEFSMNTPMKRNKKSNKTNKLESNS